MPESGDVLEVVIIPAGGVAQRIVRRALRLLSERLRNLQIRVARRPSEAIQPKLVFINEPALRQSNRGLAEALRELQQSCWREVPVIILDDPNADIVHGYATGYTARVCLGEKPQKIAQVIQRVLENSENARKELPLIS